MDNVTQTEKKIPFWRILAFALGVLVLGVAIGLSFVFLVRDVYGDYLVESEERVPRICLSADSKLDEGDVHLTVETLAEWDGVYDDYRSSMMYESLSENERFIYRAMEYAMEADLPFVCVSEHVVSESETLLKVLRCLALDSPLLEQNLRYGSRDFSASFPVDVLGMFERYAELKGYYIRVDNFYAENRTGKLAALEKAREIVASLPKDAEAEEKAELLFREIAQGAEYYDYPKAESRKVHPYLNDALLGGRANCDGYTNALALVYRLAGIECVEKNFVTDEEGVSGHTWLSFFLNGKWYNADATGDSLIPQKAEGMGGGLYYAYPDLMQKHTPMYESAYPACREGLYIKVDDHLTDTSVIKLEAALADGFRARDNRWVLVVVDSYNDKEVKTASQAVANELKIRFYRRKLSLKDGRTAIFAYTEL